MTEREAIQAIKTQWIEEWLTLHPDDPNDPDYCPFTFDNEIFETATRWARLSVRHTVSRQATMGSAPSRRFEREGVVMVQLFGNIDAGRGDLADLAADVREVLEGQRLGDVVLHAGSTDEQPTDGVWAMSAISIPFRYTENR